MNLLYPNVVLEKDGETTHTHLAYCYPKLENHPLSNIRMLTVKRAFDIVFSLAVIIFVFSWLFPIVMLLIKLSSKGPVFFRQDRHGRNNELFKCLKFRTMYVNKVQVKQATKDDPRITPIGKILRKTSIDELPQFFNVLKGEMSVVGPRPHYCKHNEKFADTIQGFMTRHMVKPGITGLAQTRGYRGETKTLQAVTGRFKLDRFYIMNWSLWMDIKIVFNTFFGVLGGDKNAY